MPSTIERLSSHPTKSNRKTPRPCDFALYRERNLIERFFNKLKHFRAIATRYDKLAKIFLAGVQLACAAILLNEEGPSKARADPAAAGPSAPSWPTAGADRLRSDSRSRWKIPPWPHRISHPDCRRILIQIVARQPDGTVACIPAWMTHESAAQHKLSIDPKLSLDALRALRAEADAPLRFLRSNSGMEEAKHDAQRDRSTARSVRSGRAPNNAEFPFSGNSWRG